MEEMTGLEWGGVGCTIYICVIVAASVLLVPVSFQRVFLVVL